MLSRVTNAIDRIARCLPALLVFVVALSSPGDAAAGCGSHVTYAGDRERHTCIPCQGPGCSQAPVAPAPATAPTVPADDAALAALFATALKPGTWFGRPCLDSLVVHRVRPPDPPPRTPDRS